MRNLHQIFDWQYIGQIIGGDFAKYCGLLRIYQLYFIRFLDPQLKKINVEFAGAMGANVKHEKGYLTGDLSQN